VNLTFISAGAGSGKTYKLTEIISQAVESGVSPEKIIATTFTNKASDEIRERVTEASFKKGDLVKVQEAPAITIGTVNSVCGQLLGKFAFEAGLSPRLRVIEVEESAALLRRVMERSVSPADRGTFFEIEKRFGYERDEKDSWLRTALDIVGAVRSNGIEAAALKLMAEQNATDLLSIFGPALVDPEPDLKDALERAIPEMEEKQREKAVGKSETYLKRCREFLTSLTKGRCSWKQWIELARGGYGKNCQEAGSVVEEMAARYRSHPRFHDDIRTYLQLCFRAAADSLDAFAAAKREAGLIDFVDQECLLNDALDSPEVQGRLSEELGLLLVDEFQDTSPIQLSVFIKLARLAERTVWVGDVKQAIYGFRGSDARLMASVLESLPSLGGQMEFLDRSWRSRPPLVQFSNALFVPAFAGELKAAHVKLTAQRSEYTDKAAFSHWLLPGNQAEQVSSLAAGILALEASKFPVMDKESQRQRPVAWKDIAVLVRENATAENVRAGLKIAGIPCEGERSGLRSRPVRALLLACLRRLNDRSDSLASAEILTLSEGLSPEDWLEERMDYLVQPGVDQGLWRCSGKEASPLLQGIESLRPLALVLSPLELSQTLVTRCHLDRIVAGWSEDPVEASQRMADLDALLELISSHQEEGLSSGANVSLSRLILWLQESENEKDLFDHEGRAGVQVLTYHSAKGLEWPVCICYETTKPIKDRAWGLSVSKAKGFSIQEPLAGRWIRFWPWPFGSLRKVDDVDLEGNEGVVDLRREAAEEARRLLYVGLTRARDLLIQALPEKTQQGGLLESLGPGAATLLKPAIPGMTSLTLPSGFSVSYACQILKPEAQAVPSKQHERELSWFKPGIAGRDALPAIITPSEAPTATAAAGAVPWNAEDYCGSQILIRGGDAKELGSIYHAMVAWACSNPGILDNEQAIADFLSRQASPLAFDAEALRISLKALFSWISSTWPGSDLCAEYPVSARLDNGQRVVGRIDLLIRTAGGLVVMDHKLAGNSDGKVQEIVATWAPQLALYATAIARVSGKPPVGTWLNLPLEGSAVRVSGAV
jgi:ATP-dependent helicase/nuclease subunit A